MTPSGIKKLPRGTRSLAHGTACRCGSCGAPGVWDTLIDGSAEFEDAVFFNKSEGHIECYECWLK